MIAKRLLGKKNCKNQLATLLIVGFSIIESSCLSIIVLGFISGLLFGCSVPERSASENQSQLSKTADKLEKVRFGMLPYADHTYAVIGAKKGWFKDVGIDFEYQTIKIEDVIPYLKNGSLEAASLPPGILFSSYDNAPELVSFVFGDLFQGYTIMAQPDKGYQSCEELANSNKNLTPAQKVKMAMNQMRGKTFAYPPETAIKPFIDLALAKGDLKQSDIKSLVLDDPLTVNAMRNKQADFQVGGAPSRVILQREGFKPILNSNDIASTAKPLPDSKELASILEDGWVTTRDYYKKHHDTVLRLASVNFRIIRFMNEHPSEALAIHMPYLSQVTGQKFSEQDGKIIYSQLDPFYSFEAQNDWFHNPKSLYFYKNVNGSILNNFIAQRIYKKNPPTVEDVILCQDLYKELEDLKQKAAAKFQQINSENLKKQPQAVAKLARAKELYSDYDYLDAEAILSKLIATQQSVNFSSHVNGKSSK
jgi:ABC-type nitrate/sulfonate/bicarbonate transport system substrate-binding protein